MLVLAITLWLPLGLSLTPRGLPWDPVAMPHLALMVLPGCCEPQGIWTTHFGGIQQWFSAFPSFV